MHKHVHVKCHHKKLWTLPATALKIVVELDSPEVSYFESLLSWLQCKLYLKINDAHAICSSPPSAKTNLEIPNYSSGCCKSLYLLLRYFFRLLSVFLTQNLLKLSILLGKSNSMRFSGVFFFLFTELSSILLELTSRWCWQRFCCFMTQLCK